MFSLPGFGATLRSGFLTGLRTASLCALRMTILRLKGRMLSDWKQWSGRLATTPHGPSALSTLSLQTYQNVLFTKRSATTAKLKKRSQDSMFLYKYTSQISVSTTETHLRVLLQQQSAHLKVHPTD